MWGILGIWTHALPMRGQLNVVVLVLYRYMDDTCEYVDVGLTPVRRCAVRWSNLILSVIGIWFI